MTLEVDEGISLMDIMYGILGVLALTLFAAVLGFDVRHVSVARDSGSGPDLATIDPNSTLGVTQAVFKEAVGDRPEHRLVNIGVGGSIVAEDSLSPAMRKVETSDQAHISKVSKTSISPPALR